VLNRCSRNTIERKKGREGGNEEENVDEGPT
jgi:hypothetical protein